MNSTQQIKIDENLYSRQIGAFGLEAQGKLVKMKVFIYGIRGIGIETAKNLILAGPNTVVIHDDSLVEMRDLGSNFYLNGEDVGKKTRSEASLPYLKELNLYVNIGHHKGEITLDFLKHFDVVVFTDYYDLDELIRFNNFCRSQENPIGFILCGSLGLYGFTFVDYGDKFRIFDGTGEDPRQTIIVNITKDENGIVTVHEKKKHSFITGDLISFSEVEGMEELNGKTFPIKVLSPFRFSIGDTRNFSDYKKNGIATQVKPIEELSFKNLETSLIAPIPLGKTELNTADYAKDPNQLHLILNGIFIFYKKYKRLPLINDNNDANELIAIVKEIKEINIGLMDIEGKIKLHEINENLIRNVAFYSQAQISPCVSFWGGIIAQEIVKFTGKFTPLHQWLHYDSFESLPEEKVNQKLMNSRYDDIIAIFGRETLEKLKTLKYFFKKIKMN